MPSDNVAHTLVSKYHVQSILESMEVCSALSSLHQLNLITGDRPSHELKPLLCASSLSFFFFVYLRVPVCECECEWHSTNGGFWDFDSMHRTATVITVAILLWWPCNSAARIIGLLRFLTSYPDIHVRKAAGQGPIPYTNSLTFICLNIT